MPISSSRQRRPMSAGTLRELYGVPVPQLRNSEQAFHKELFKRDKLRLKLIVAAIDNEKKHVERKWKNEVSRFTREHAEVMNLNRGKAVYRKIGTLSAQSENSVTPCIPFVGAFQPSHHSTKERRVSELVMKAFHNRSPIHESDRWTDGNGGDRGSERNPFQENYSYFKASHQVVSSFTSASIHPPHLSDTNNGNVHNKSCSFSANGSKSSLPDNRDYVPKSAPLQSWMSCDDNDHFRGAENGNTFTSNGNNRYTDKANFKICVSGRNDNEHCNEETMDWRATDNGNSQYTTSTNALTNLNRPENKGRVEGQKTVVKKSPPSSDKMLVSQTNRQSRMKRQSSQQDMSPGDSTSSGSTTSGSLDVELLQQALVDHSNRCLIRNRWQRATESVLRHLSGEQDDEEKYFLHNANLIRGPSLPAASISLPPTQTATDSPEDRQDSGMMMVQMILELFKELDQPQVNNLAEVWPRKMESMMSTIQDLVKKSGLEITEIVEKIQREDVQDEKSAALLNWVKNVDTTAAAGDQEGENEPIVGVKDNRKGQRKSHGQIARSLTEPNKHKGPRSRCSHTFKSPDQESGKEKSQPQSTMSAISSESRPGNGSSMTETVRDRPVIHVVPPSSPQSDSSQPDSYRGRCQSAGAAHFNTLTSRLHALRRKDTVQHIASQPSIHVISGTKTPSLRRRSGNSECRKSSGHPDSHILNIRRQSMSPICCKVSDRGERFSSKLPDMASPLLNVEGKAYNQEHEDITCADQKHSPQPARTASRSMNSGKAPSSASCLSVSATNCVLSSRGENAPSGNDRSHVKSARKVSFCQTWAEPITSLKFTEERKGKVRNGNADLNPRISGATGLSRSLSSESPENQPTHFRRRAFSTGQQRCGRTVSRDRYLITGSAGQRTPGKPESPSTFLQCKARYQDVSQPSSLINSAGSEGPVNVTSPERLQSTETVLHTDRLGKTHRLTMRKLSLANMSMREANVIVTREDSAICQEPYQNDETGTDDKEDALETLTDEVTHDSRIEIGEQEQDIRILVSPHQNSSSEVHIGVDEEPEQAPDEVDKHPRESDEDEGLWKRRLTRPHSMSWVQELSTDHKAQGMALSLLQRKEKGSQQFRSTILKVICINALRAAKNVYDDAAFHRLKQCRYLRMPERYLSDTQRTLSVREIFS